MQKISYTVKEASEVTGMSRQTLWRLIKVGDLRAVRPKTAKLQKGERIDHQGTMLILHRDLEKFLENSEEVT